ncbi:tRNA (uracil-5-)-methyltransferase homolog A-like isoform X2 [Penaeus monodon]|uniref:tRNA (uracil-5-)-methyltransferase homolog A-like isoform X2 n=1 Tax=Penaeus monodon TaxID=6687 RepID=UPI0018A7AA0B|nr:tRNA (uracil-5-)-methyltransferase homolog A-like isoform X2 [Penaeus monodon]
MEGVAEGTEGINKTQDELNAEESMEVENGGQKEEVDQDQKEGSFENGDGNKKNTEKDKDKTGEGEAEGEGEDEGSDPYAYTRRDEFTSENFKIEVRGLPRYYPVGQLKKLLNDTLQLNAHKVKPAGQGKTWAYVTFRDEKARQKALVVLDKYKWKKCILTSSIAKPVEDPLIKQREQSDQRSNSVSNDKLTILEKVVKSVTPYAHLSYDDQLKEKEKIAKNVLRKFGSELGRVNPELTEWVTWHKLRRKGQVCEIDPIIPSPVTDAYRNKCEFTIGINPETEQPTVGFRIASYREGSMCVAPIEHLCHLPDPMKKVVKVFETFVRSSSYMPFSPLTHDGVWRQLTVRTTRNKDIMVVVVVHPQQMNDEELGAIKKSIVDLFLEGAGKPLGVTSIFFQAYGQKERGVEEKYEHLWGEQFITETILGKKFRVSPDAFLQVNTAAGEVLYETIGNVAALDGTSVLLDVCCGTGTIGISLAERCLKVYGVELVKKAAEDARFNAENNDIKNVVIYEGKAEDHVKTMVENCEQYDTIGVVDPPRAGLHGNVVCGLRRCENMKRLVYVSCDPANACKNFINLARGKSKQYKGDFFIPIRAVPIDLFPHTPHFELVILFERWDELKWRRIMEGDPLPRDAEYFKRIPSIHYDAKKADREGKVRDSNTGMGVWKVVSKDRGPPNKGRPYYKPRHHPYGRDYPQDQDRPYYPNYKRGSYQDFEPDYYGRNYRQSYNQDYRSDYGPPERHGPPPSRAGPIQPPSRAGPIQPPSRAGPIQPPSRAGPHQHPSRAGLGQPPFRAPLTGPPHGHRPSPQPGPHIPPFSQHSSRFRPNFQGDYY